LVNYFAAPAVVSENPAFAMSQLILTLDDNLLQAAREYTQQHGQNLEALVTQFLQATVQPVEVIPPARPLSPRIQRLFGAVQVPDDFDYKKVLDKAVQERYGV
jgi:hypothetical protein